MECPSCQRPVSETDEFCTNCGRPLRQPAETLSPLPVPAPSTAASLAPQPETVAAPQPPARVGPPAGAPARSLYFDFNEKPASIVRVMDDARREQAEFARKRSQRFKIAWLLLPAGLPFCALDLLMGYNWCTFSLVAGVLWAAAIIGLVLLARNRPADDKQFGPQFEIARTVFDTIRDDISPKRTLTGWLDLTGPRLASKVVQQRTAASGMPINFYQDEWLRMKMSLYDGSLMRVSVVEREKVKMGRYKRGGSGKMKFRPGGTVWSRRELRVALTPNPEVHTVGPVQRVQVGKFMIDASASSAQRLVLVAAAQDTINAQDILSLLRFAHDHLKPLHAPAETPPAFAETLPTPTPAEPPPPPAPADTLPFPAPAEPSPVPAPAEPPAAAPVEIPPAPPLADTPLPPAPAAGPS